MKDEIVEQPMSFDRFLALYYLHLSASDRPSCFIAYCRAEAEVVRQTGERRYANYNAFKVTKSRHFAKKKAENQFG